MGFYFLKILTNFHKYTTLYKIFNDVIMIVNFHVIWQYALELITLSLELIGVLIIFLGIIV